ncbi:nuclear transport factor 2 family protein [Cupriavidus basilensis]
MRVCRGDPNPAVYEGRPAIEGFLKARASRRDVVSAHVVTNVRMIPQDDGGVVATSAVTLFRGTSMEAGTAAAFIANVIESYVLELDGVWRIKERIVIPRFAKTVS